MVSVFRVWAIYDRKWLPVLIILPFSMFPPGLNIVRKSSCSDTAITHYVSFSTFLLPTGKFPAAGGAMMYRLRVRRGPRKCGDIFISPPFTDFIVDVRRFRCFHPRGLTNLVFSAAVPLLTRSVTIASDVLIIAMTWTKLVRTWRMKDLLDSRPRIFGLILRSGTSFESHTSRELTLTLF